jgi:hypothetical protein
VDRIIPSNSRVSAVAPDARMQLIDLDYRSAGAQATRPEVEDNKAGPKLPVVNVEVSAPLFAVISPLIVLTLYMFLSSFLRRLWLAFANLPATFPDGTDLDERGYPSPISGLVRRHLCLLKDNQPIFYKIEYWTTSAIIYFVAPMTIAYLLFVDCRTALPIGITAIHTIAFVMASLIGLATFKSLARLIADRLTFKVDRLPNEELNNLVQIQKDENQERLRRKIAGLRS